MSDATIIAALILSGVFIIMIVSIVKSGIEGAIKMWNLMGALTGVAFGAITSFYFTNQINQHDIRELESALDKSLDTAQHAQQQIALVESAIKATSQSGNAVFPEPRHHQLVRELENTNIRLLELEQLRPQLIRQQQ